MARRPVGRRPGARRRAARHREARHRKERRRNLLNRRDVLTSCTLTDFYTGEDRLREVQAAKGADRLHEDLRRAVDTA